MTTRLWHWDNEETAIVSNQDDCLSIEEFIMYVNGLERECAADKDLYFIRGKLVDEAPEM